MAHICYFASLLLMTGLSKDRSNLVITNCIIDTALLKLLHISSTLKNTFLGTIQDIACIFIVFEFYFCQILFFIYSLCLLSNVYSLQSLLVNLRDKPGPAVTSYMDVTLEFPLWVSIKFYLILSFLNLNYTHIVYNRNLTFACHLTQM